MTTTRNNKSLEQEFLAQILSSVKSLFDLTSRIDERVKGITKKQEDYEIKLEKLLEFQNKIESRIAVIESQNGQELEKKINELAGKLQDAEKISKDAMHQIELKVEALNIFKVGAENRLNKYFDLVLKILWALVTAYILYKVGLPIII